MATIQQRSRFVTSSYRDKLKAALDFRNMFASRPYLCDVSLDTGDTVCLYTDIVEVAWPVTLTSGQLETRPDHSLRLTSVDEWAQVILAPTGQHFTVKFLCALDKVIAWQPRWTGSEGELPGRGGDCGDKAGDTDSGPGRTYVWTTQHHSVADYPDHWHHPVELLLSYVSMATNDDESLASHCLTNKTENKNLAAGTRDRESSEVITSLVENRKTNKLVPCVVTRLPQALPLNCTAQQLHRWRNDDATVPSGGSEVYYGGRLKVVCSQGVIYRLLRSVPSAIEVYPGDDSVLRSTGMTAVFFKHFLHRNDKVEERMYSVDSPPPHVPGLPYPIARLLSTATRFMRQVQGENLQLLPADVAVCWQTKHIDLVPPLASVLLEECDIPNVGRFTAHSSGHVRIVFTDRTCLDMFADFQHRLATCQQHSDTEVPKVTSEWTELPKGVCRLLLPTGHYHMVQVVNPGIYTKYVAAAMDWAGWVNSSPSERYMYYKDSLYDTDKRATVDSELKKIRCFNYLLETGHTDHIRHNTPTVTMATTTNDQSQCNQAQEVNFDLIQDVLRKTSAAVQDLGQFLTLARETSQVRHGSVDRV
ncbi:hypothetical protein NP493_1116g00002 [Ridgeia piscesae]|uniref:DUF4520 domain-containing protein n=1 Tax=Ridgeia piscesae TaxID=27915 RepID=A0AAD9NJW8_RIDPI|nr:hypothetical protein NP493_1116g00002 [Ridgeia piscesae]